ncbi:MAG: hypothetical protein ACYS74_08050 [Planctomycetota bacterium]
MIAKARRELTLLEEYTSVVDEKVGGDWKERIEGIIDDLEEDTTTSESDDEDTKPVQERRDQQSTLRAELKSLRETVAWYDRTWAIGEWMRTCVTYWVSAAVLATVAVGILPIIHSQGNWNLTIAHWAALGISGALLSILLNLHNLDLPELGETEGKQLLQGTVRSIAIGGVAAILLYAALWGEALDGKVFPDLPTGGDHVQWQPTESLEYSTDITVPLAETATEDDAFSLRSVGLSIFWAVFAGLSPVVFQRLAQVAQSSLGELAGGGSEE